MIRTHNMTHRQTVVGEQLISYTESDIGMGETPYTFVFLHGWGSSSDIWAPLSKELAGAFQKALLIDLPGFGMSPAPKEAWGVAEYALVVLQLIEQKRLSSVVLVGHSFGGQIAHHIAGALQPDWLAGLILISSASIRKSRKTLLSRLYHRSSNLFSFEPSGRLREYARRMVGSSDYLLKPELQETFKKVIADDQSRYAQRIHVPTLLIWGEDDDATPLVQAKQLEEMVPNAKLAVISHAGHFSFKDKPAQTMKEIRAFLYTLHKSR